MSKLTKFEALQLAAILCARQKSHHPPFDKDVEELFECAETIMAEDKRRNDKQNNTLTIKNLSL